jgi:hypothetical protein
LVFSPPRALPILPLCDSGNKRTKEAKGNAAAATNNIIRTHRERREKESVFYMYTIVIDGK